MSETLDKLKAKGSYKATEAEIAKRYSCLRGVLGSLAGALPGIVLGVLVAVTARPFVYTIQDLPGWMNAYVSRPEIGDALAYMRGEMPGATVFDYLRIADRFLLFPFVGLLGTLNDEMSLWFDRLSPLLALLMPVLCAVGYLFGPGRRAKEVKAIEQAKNTPRRRLKRDRRRNREPAVKKQLI